MTLPVLVINRAVDGQRLQRFRQKARAQGVKPIRIAALDGHRMDCPFHLWSDLIGAHFWGEDRIKPGALACYLSHRLAWQHVVEQGWDRALICEDDADLAEPLERVEGIAAGLGDFDILFANDRLVTGGGDTVPLDMALAVMEAKAPGADCYLITRRGAERMLALSAEQKIVCGVDWAMVWNGLGGDASASGPEIEILDRYFQRDAARLDVHVLCQPVATLRGVGSSIEHGHQVPLASLTTPVERMVHADYAVHLGHGAARLSFLGRSGSDPVMEAHREGALWEDAPLGELIRRFPEGGCFVDIGAHLGNHTVALGRLAHAAVIAVEPNPEIRRLLEMNIALNGLEGRVTLHMVAAGAEEGRGTISIHRRKPAQSSVHPGPPKPAKPTSDEDLPAFDTAAKPTASVAVQPMDTLIEDIRVDAIKIDTSGREVEVLKGLKRTLKRQTPILLIDHHVNDIDRIAGLLDRFGYTRHAHYPHDRPNRAVSLYLPQPRQPADPSPAE
ncbi:MAG: FkbM family methyltransferase [Pseudomonadota bacterium]